MRTTLRRITAAATAVRPVTGSSPDAQPSRTATRGFTYEMVEMRAGVVARSSQK
jgi:hypothetical protein